MFGSLVEEIRLEMIKKDITNIRPLILQKGREAVQDIKINKRYSRTKLRKWGILPNPYKKRGPWKPKP